MKKLIVIIVIVFQICVSGFAQDRGLFGYGETRETTNNREGGNNTSLINLPVSHGGTEDQGAPLGSGALLLTALGAAYAIKNRKNRN